MPMVWIYRGQKWPIHSRLQEFSVEDADRAEAEDWGQRIEGVDGRDCKPWTAQPHAAADAFYTRMTDPVASGSVELPPAGASPSVGGSYGTREMRAAPPGSVAIMPPEETPIKRGPGRPKKTDS
jgi:hypothetical protein